MNNILKIIFTIIGTFIGAGFASGKEIYLFFFRYDYWGIIGIIISSVFIGYIIYKTLNICSKNYIENYDEFLDNIIKNNYIKNIIKNIIQIFLLISFCVMIAGFGAFLQQEFNINNMIACCIILVFCKIIFNKNINGIIKLNDILIPIIIVIVIHIMVKKVDNSILSLLFFGSKNKFNYKFLINSFLYSNYNLLTIIPIITTLNKLVKNNKSIKKISILISIIIIILSLSIFIILDQGGDNINKLDMPVINIVSQYR